MNEIRVQERNYYPTLLVFVSVYSVTSTGTYPDMHRRMCLVDEHKSGAIRGNNFFPAPLGPFFFTVRNPVQTSQTSSYFRYRVAFLAAASNATFADFFL
jgi:hypothetical protein